jgi:uncharacterized protein YdeI (YjbR/CyaY-like superfamily)
LVPEAEETLKWGMPSFILGGKILAGMAAFKAYATVNFWRGEELGLERKGSAMGQLGRLTSLDELPPDFDELIRRATELALTVPAPRKPKAAPKAASELHPEFAKALETAPKAKAVLDGFPPSAQREYVEWISDAKQDATRANRIATAIEWLSEGKRRHWKYENC